VVGQFGPRGQSRTEGVSGVIAVVGQIGQRGQSRTEGVSGVIAVVGQFGPRGQSANISGDVWEFVLLPGHAVRLK
jgi:hypothetical protein